MKTTSRSELTHFPCDYCGTLSECRFEYLDPHKDDLPMLFCGIDCLRLYVLASNAASFYQHGKRSRVKHGS